MKGTAKCLHAFTDTEHSGAGRRHFRRPFWCKFRSQARRWRWAQTGKRAALQESMATKRTTAALVQEPCMYSHGSIDAWNQNAYVKASNTGVLDQFGFTVAFSGNTLAAGAPGEASCVTGINGDQANKGVCLLGAQ